MNPGGYDNNRSSLEPHRVVLTRDAELHLVDRACVAVRDRRSGDWQAQHVVLGATLPLAPGALRLGSTLVLELRGEAHEAGEVLATEQLSPDDSDRVLARAREALDGPEGGARLRRWSRLLAISGLLPWLSPRDRDIR